MVFDPTNSPTNAISDRVSQMSSDELVDYVRQLLKENLEKQQQSSDLDHLVKSTRAIISTNKEIWDRCKESKCETLPGKSSGIFFKRVGYNKIDVKTSSFRYGKDYLTFETKPELTTKEFDLPECVPDELTDIMSLKQDEDSVLPDYERFFERTLLLHDDILIQFLEKLRDHLEAIQVYLGDIETWLIQPIGWLSFVNDHFKDVKLAPSEELSCSKRSCRQRHEADDRCLKCLSRFIEHDYHECPRHGVNGGRAGSFLVRSPKVLLKCGIAGNHDHVFDISDTDGQKKLKKFLDFASC